MQTFLPYANFARSAAVLDDRRLGKQRVETLQILRALTFDDYGWRNHPAVTMWAGATDALVAYGVAVTRAWRRAGFADTVEPQILEFLGAAPLRTQAELREASDLPSWVGWHPLHRSHQAALLRKDAAHYAPRFGNVDPNLPYVWPDPGVRPHVDEPRSGWVVRVEPNALPMLLHSGTVGLRPTGDETSDHPAGVRTRSTKRQRLVNAFCSEISPGDRVVVPANDVLHVGEVMGEYEWRDDALAGLHHSRRVRWITAVHRSDLRRPVHLQDPRTVFALRGEPILADLD